MHHILADRHTIYMHPIIYFYADQLDDVKPSCMPGQNVTSYFYVR